MGYALLAAQFGETGPSAKPLRGFGGAPVLEIVATHRTDAFRAVYTVRLADAVYVLHAFQKKSRRGIATPKAELETVRRRLREAEAIHRARSGGARASATCRPSRRAAATCSGTSACRTPRRGCCGPS